MRCFVIGPIGDQLADAGSAERQSYEEAVQVFEEIIKAACKSFEIDPYRADDIEDPVTSRSRYLKPCAMRN